MQLQPQGVGCSSRQGSRAALTQCRPSRLQPPVCTSSLCRISQSSRGRLQIVAGERQNSNVTTKRRLSGGTGLPPIDGGDDGGGGGGDGWGWERTARNLLPNIAFLGLYFAITSYGGDGWGGGGFFGGGGGGGGGGGDGQFGQGSSQPDGGSAMREDAGNDHAGDEEGSSSEDDSSEEAAPVYNYNYNRRNYR
ncbi:hypothetical protein COO60DRAFT_1702425 [Scenedesmus sp. NREL 46B-D3]|nr:hypothetical protein COO60DRAFT_1702425 [Scenedesmus sp. NREL 46B-D3]